MTKKDSKRLLIAGGGTGGHVLAGIAVAEAWLKQNDSEAKKNSHVLFVGAAGGIEEKLVPRAGFTLKVLSIGSLNRVTWFQKLKTSVQLPFSFLKAFWILITFRPQIVLGVGGYSSGPVVLLAKVLESFFLLRTQVGILEQNAVPGMTNKILSRFSDIILTAFPGTEAQFPNKRVVVTGNPIRSSIQYMPPAKREPFTVFVFGGSQGAMGINTLVLASLNHLSDLSSKLRFIHQTGEKDYDRVVQGYQKSPIQARIEKFIYDMPTAYSESSLLICRAGSSTLSEISAVGRASVLVPLPTAADNHQEKNARIFSEKGAAFVLLQQATTGEKLANLIRELILNPEKLTQMEVKVRELNRPEAAKDVLKAFIQKDFR